jgi:polysaccharide export outer membrane protein
MCLRPHLARSRQILVCLAAGTLAGCMIIPGNQAYSHRDESDVRLPIQQGDTLAPANVKIKPITAELIIDHVQGGPAASRRRDQLCQGGGEEQSSPVKR